MNLLISIITNATIGKWIYGLVASIQTLGLIQETFLTNQTFFDALLDNVPAQLIYVLGIIYGIALVLSKLSDMWRNHKINKLKVKIEKEHLEQQEISTEQKRKKM